MATSKAAEKATRINVYIKDGLLDGIGEGIAKDIADLAITGIKSVRAIRAYTIIGNISDAATKKIGSELLADAVTQEYTIGAPPETLTKGAWVVHVKFNPGVTDAVGETACKGISDLKIKGVSQVRTSNIFVISGKVTKAQVDEICRRLLANSVIQSYSIEKH